MSIRKRTWKTGDGLQKEAWVVDYVDQKGKRRLKTFDRKKEADAWWKAAGFEIEKGFRTPDSQSVTIAKAAELWLETCRGHKLERSTIDAYAQHVENHIAPYLAREKLSQFTAPMVREFEDRLRNGAAAPGAAEGKPRSSAMVKKIIGSLGSLIADAQERGLIGRNVVRELSKRRKGADRRLEKRHKGKLKIGVDIPSRDEVKAIVDHLEGRWRPILLTAIFTGLRSSELRGLRWSDVDLKKCELHVRQRVDQYSVMGAPKSESGQRTVPLPPVVANTLREWKLACPKSKVDLVFPTGRGTPENHANVINRGLIPAQLAAGVTTLAHDAKGMPLKDEDGKPVIRAKYTGLHAFRHFYASWCVNSREDGGLGLSAKAAQGRLGHSTIAMTLDTYGHLFPRGDDGSELAAAEKALLG
ncbi:tyrosine-type recombinase/integrase [Methylocella silvestris]|uniref:Site-specific integrase n=1 Tax=Methylocella silvestris TaxID=199596 RepID=A0A2J7TMB4_METSI|nr:site-specific integrase [Methylocella silvestris]PNG27912.1 site-specific integrase [Methylocella silvestris]